jgi:peptidoglycan/LPS O-acetylase OafA/YrhL
VFGKLFPVFRNDVSAVILNGRFAVVLFFCISGFALTVGSWREPKIYVARQLLKRHSRLAIPVFAGALVIYFLMLFGLTANDAAMTITKTFPWVGGKLSFDPSECNVVQFALIDVFWFFRERCDYNPFLWTMSFELWGSVLVLLISLIERRWLPYYILGGLAVVANFFQEAGGAVTCFALGAMLALAYKDRMLREIPSWIAIAGIVVCLLVVGLTPDYYLRHFAMAPAAGLVLLLALSARAPTAFLTNRFSQFLGQISFPLYLMHWAVIVSFTSHLILWFNAAGNLNEWTALFISVASVLFAVLCATIFLPVEWLTAWVGRQLQRLIPARAVPASAPPVVR